MIANRRYVPFRPGLEFSGTVVSVGGGVGTGAAGNDTTTSPIQKGRCRFRFYEVWILRGHLVKVGDACTLCKLPSHWTHVQGAAFLVNALTAWYGLVHVAGMPNCNGHQQRYGCNKTVT